MRKVIAFLLLAGAAAPALAAGGSDDRHGGWRHDSNQQSTSDDNSNRNSDRSDRPRFTRQDRNDNGNNDRPQPDVRSRQQFQMNNGGSDNADRRSNGDARARFTGGEQPAVETVRRDDGRSNDSVRNWRGRDVEVNNGGQTNDGVRNWRGSNNSDAWRGRVVENPNVTPDNRRADRPFNGLFRNRVPVVSDRPVEGSQPRIRLDSRHRDSVTNWNHRWRNDNRYDWQNWRRRHGSTFHLGFYFDPFGWNYRPYQVGWRLWPSYYQQNYWLNDPWQYRLPYAPPGTQWIRYYNDALLVDTWTGEVVDVIPNFFW